MTFVDAIRLDVPYLTLYVVQLLYLNEWLTRVLSSENDKKLHAIHKTRTLTPYVLDLWHLRSTRIVGSVLISPNLPQLSLSVTMLSAENVSSSARARFAPLFPQSTTVFLHASSIHTSASTYVVLLFHNFVLVVPLPYDRRVSPPPHTSSRFVFMRRT